MDKDLGTDYAALHVHTEHSTLDGLAKLDDLCRTAAADGNPAVAITDHGTLSGAWRLGKKAKAHGIKPIIGIEAYLSIGSRHEKNSMLIPRDGYSDPDETDSSGSNNGMKAKTYEHLTVLAQTAEGFSNLSQMSSKSSESVWYKPRIDMELLGRHHKGLIALTGCIGGPIAGPLTRNQPEQARAALIELIEAMGHTATDRRVFVEIMDHGIAAEHRANAGLITLAKEFDLLTVATNDSHYVHPEQAADHDFWLAVSTVGQRKGTSSRLAWLDEPGRFRFSGSAYHLRSGAEMHALFDGQPGTESAVANTMVVADMIDANVLPESYIRLPKFPIPDGFDNADAYLRHLVTLGSEQRFGGRRSSDEVQDRINRELKVISDLEFPDYFLIVWDLLNWARSEGIRIGAGRGSSAGSIVSYCTYIVKVDPLEFGLYFERFLDPTRTEMPDIDIDFDTVGKPKAVAYLRDKYGSEFVAQLGALGMVRAKDSLKSSARVLLPEAESQAYGAALSKLIPFGMDLKESLDPANPKSLPLQELIDSDPIYRQIVDHAFGIENTIKSESIHACGVIVSTAPLSSMVPLRKDPDSGSWVTQWDGYDTPDVGLLKLDVLGLRNLDIISSAVSQIERTTGEKLDMDALTYDPKDPRTQAMWEMLGRGRTSGVFQLESSGIAELCEKMQPTSIHDLAALLALYRPGPLGMNMHIRYAERRNGREEVDYGIFTNDPAEQAVIAAVLENSYGTMVYQETLMAIGQAVAGFGAAESNNLRRAVSKKDAVKMAKAGDEFTAGAIVETFDEQGNLTSPAFSITTANNLWDAIKGAGKYAFVKAHSAAYAWTTRETAYLKANWPAQYGAALLSVTDKAEVRLNVISDLRSVGLVITSPSVNAGFVTTECDANNNIRIGMSEIKGVGSDVSQAIVDEREANGQYESLAALITRVQITAPGKRATGLASSVIVGLIEAGALDEFGPRLGLLKQARVLSSYPAMPAIDAEWPHLVRAARERARLGVVVSVPPLVALRDEIAGWNRRQPRPAVTVAHLAKLPMGETEVATLGLITSVQDKVSKAGNSYAVMTLEGSSGRIECSAFGRSYTNLVKAWGALPRTGQLVCVRGSVKTESFTPNAPDEEFDEAGELVDRPAPSPVTRRTLRIFSMDPISVHDPARINLPPVTGQVYWPIVHAAPAAMPGLPADAAVAGTAPVSAARDFDLLIVQVGSKPSNWGHEMLLAGYPDLSDVAKVWPGRYVIPSPRVATARPLVIAVVNGLSKMRVALRVVVADLTVLAETVNSAVERSGKSTEGWEPLPAQMELDPRLAKVA